MPTHLSQQLSGCCDASRLGMRGSGAQVRSSGGKGPRGGAGELRAGPAEGEGGWSEDASGAGFRICGGTAGSGRSFVRCWPRCCCRLRHPDWRRRSPGTREAPAPRGAPAQVPAAAAPATSAGPSSGSSSQGAAATAAAVDHLCKESRGQGAWQCLLRTPAPRPAPSNSPGPQVFPRVTPRGDPARRGEDRLQGGEGRLASPKPPPTALTACRLDGPAPALAHGLRNCIPRPPAPSQRNNPILTEAHGTLVPPRHPVGKIKQFAQFLPLPKWPSLGQQQGQPWSPHSHSLLIDAESEK